MTAADAQGCGPGDFRCRIVHLNMADLVIAYCHRHAAAAQMVEALRKLRETNLSDDEMDRIIRDTLYLAGEDS